MPVFIDDIMRVENPYSKTSYYLSRVKDNQPPDWIFEDRRGPDTIIIDDFEVDVYSNICRSRYTYINYKGEWMATLDSGIIYEGDINLQITDPGRPFKKRNKKSKIS